MDYFIWEAQLYGIQITTGIGTNFVLDVALIFPLLHRVDTMFELHCKLETVTSCTFEEILIQSVVNNYITMYQFEI